MKARITIDRSECRTVQVVDMQNAFGYVTSRATCEVHGDLCGSFGGSLLVDIELDRGDIHRELLERQGELLERQGELLIRMQALGEKL